MNIREQREIILTMNPKQLRDLADKVEKIWPKLLIGDSTFVDILGYINNTKVVLNLDQEYMHKHYETFK